MGKKKSNIIKLSIEKKEEVKEGSVKKPEYKTLAEEIAQSTVFVKNFYLNELREKFSHADRVKRFDMFFPYAKLEDGKPTVKLYVDTPHTSLDEQICDKKAKLMKDLGLKYLILQEDTKIFDARIQLGLEG